ncbi:hypothetical protein JW992_13275 [candidate division KSB1 bacterium]|nr:hypothetical protein [candidate division KSB1 bacterium]
MRNPSSLLGLCGLFFFIYPLNAQSVLPSNVDETLWLEVRRESIQRAFNAAGVFLPSPVFQEIDTLLQQAGQLVNIDDAEGAMVLLELAEALIAIYPSQTILSEPERRFVQHRVSMGLDLWQQQFGIVLTDKDSVLSESEYNPAFGWSSRYAANSRLYPTWQAEVDLKFSREYWSGFVRGRVRKNLMSGICTADNRLEATRYRYFSDWRYVQNRTRIEYEYALGQAGSFSGQVQAEGRLYEAETTLLNHYFGAETGVGLNLLVSSRDRLDLQVSTGLRRHPSCAPRNFYETFAALRHNRLSKRLFLHNRFDYRQRIYPAAFVDSLYTSDFRQITAESMARCDLSAGLSVGLETQIDWRLLQENLSTLPSYRQIRVEPFFQLVKLPMTTVQIGYPFILRNYWGQSSIDYAWESEDYAARGPSLSLDWIQSERFFLSLIGEIQFRRYADSQDESEAALPIYADRNVYSLLLNLSWNLTKNFEISAFLHVNLDHDADIQGSDFSSNLLNFKLSYQL